MIFGDLNALQFEFIPGSHDQALGFGTLRAYISKSPIWTDEQDRGIAWTWIDLLEQLGRSWPFLKYDESAPSGTYDGALSLLRNGHIASPDYFEPAPESSGETYIFLRRHNLATGIEGLYLPSLSLLREGRKIWVASENVAKALEFEPTIQTLAALGDAIASHIATATQQERSRLALEVWRNREPSFTAALQIRLGSSRFAAEMVPPGQSIAAYFDAENEEAAEPTLLIAARMSEAVPLKSRRRILELLRGQPVTSAPQLLKDVSTKAESIVPEFTRRPHEQGEILARWARTEFSILPEKKADPEQVLKQLGVAVTEHHLGIDMIDAIGCWGAKHGPAILVNLDGKHAQDKFGRRATLAHELAHVLIDRHGSLPAAEVFGGNVPRHPEQRANAFAAEFLLPKSILTEKLRNTTDAVREIRSLRVLYGVSQALTGWHIYNTKAVYTELTAEAKDLVTTWRANTETEWSLR